MSTQTEFMAEAKNWPKSDKCRAALACELMIAYNLGVQKAPQERLIDWIAQVSEVYSRVFMREMMTLIMDKAIKTNAPTELVLISNAIACLDWCKRNEPILHNLREALIKEFGVVDEEEKQDPNRG